MGFPNPVAKVVGFINIYKSFFVAFYTFAFIPNTFVGASISFFQFLISGIIRFCAFIPWNFRNFVSLSDRMAQKRKYAHKISGL